MHHFNFFLPFKNVKKQNCLTIATQACLHALRHASNLWDKWSSTEMKIEIWLSGSCITGKPVTALTMSNLCSRFLWTDTNCLRSFKLCSRRDSRLSITWPWPRYTHTHTVIHISLPNWSSRKISIYPGERCSMRVLMKNISDETWALGCCDVLTETSSEDRA